MILLTDEEIDIVLMQNCRDGYGGVAKAQLKKVVVEIGGMIMLQRNGDFILEQGDWQALLEEAK